MSRMSSIDHSKLCITAPDELGLDEVLTWALIGEVSRVSSCLDIGVRKMG